MTQPRRICVAKRVQRFHGAISARVRKEIYMAKRRHRSAEGMPEASLSRHVARGLRCNAQRTCQRSRPRSLICHLRLIASAARSRGFECLPFPDVLQRGMQQRGSTLAARQRGARAEACKRRRRTIATDAREAVPPSAEWQAPSSRDAVVAKICAAKSDACVIFPAPQMRENARWQQRAYFSQVSQDCR